MKVKLKCCPFCGENNLKIKGDRNGSWIYCFECGAETAMADSYYETISSWNARKDGEVAEYEIKDEESDDEDEN